MTNTADADRSPTDVATDAVVARCKGDHTRYCAWHAVMAADQNWADSQNEDPTAEWCKGEPTACYLTEAALELLDTNCDCEA